MLLTFGRQISAVGYSLSLAMTRLEAPVAERVAVSRLKEPLDVERPGTSCLANERAAPDAEIGDLWRSIARSYVLLFQREERLTAEERERTERARRNGNGSQGIS